MTNATPSSYALLFFQGAIWGSSFQAIKFALEGFGPMTVAAGRIGLAAVMMLLYARARGHRLPRNGRVLGMLAIVGLFNCAIPFFLIPWGEQSLDSGRTAIFMATGPLIALAIAHFTTTDERLNRFKLLGFVMGFVGVLLVIGLDSFSAGAAEWLPQLAIIGAATSYAISGAIAKRVLNVSSSVFTACVLSSAALMTLPASLILETPVTDLAATGLSRPLLALIYLGLIPTGLAFLIRFHLIKTVGYTFVSQVGYLVPVFGVLFGALIFQEAITANIVTGLCLILTGIFVSRLSARHREPL
ncbi:DMT family transporter [Reinekea blandensis]|uniref:ABC transporter, membrane spanning protein n=1 Tax=Reinekea blandensis MED297 TaxID=314283 RepID=A4BAZ8_9GAMM|nr:DMT family transporter [Reinekea blandensis]EAR10611.1 ABC transporter, membrane spanning protein [Reinekea sp. MED297] [Reinekea blandensis MED297]